MNKNKPFDDLLSLIENLPSMDACAVRKITAQTGTQTLNNFSGGSLSSWLAGWQGTEQPSVAESHINVLISSYKGYDTASVLSFVAKASTGKSAVNALCVDNGIGLRVLEMAPELPYDSNVPWSDAECMAAIAFGMEATAAGGNLLGLASFAPGEHVYAALIISLICKQADLQWVKGFFTEDEFQEFLATKQNTINPLDILVQFGGREIAAAIGAIIAARSARLPVLGEGWAFMAAVATLENLKPNVTDHVMLASVTDDKQACFAKAIGMHPILNCQVSSGVGCGVALAVNVLKASVILIDVN